jgi:hypothetical protein
VFYNEAQLPGRQLVAHETSVDACHKPVSGQSIDVASSVATIAFIGSDHGLLRSILGPSNHV